MTWPEAIAAMVACLCGVVVVICLVAREIGWPWGRK